MRYEGEATLVRCVTVRYPAYPSNVRIGDDHKLRYHYLYLLIAGVEP
jgi:hypothetical protein